MLQTATQRRPRCFGDRHPQNSMSWILGPPKSVIPLGLEPPSVIAKRPRREPGHIDKSVPVFLFCLWSGPKTQDTRMNIRIGLGADFPPFSKAAELR